MFEEDRWSREPPDAAADVDVGHLSSLGGATLARLAFGSAISLVTLTKAASGSRAKHAARRPTRADETMDTLLHAGGSASYSTLCRTMTLRLR